MRVLFVDQYVELGGAQQCLLDLLPTVIASGRRAELCLPGPGPMAERAREAGAEVGFASFGRYSSGRKPVAEMARFAWDSFGLRRYVEWRIEGFRPDLLYVNGPRVLPAAAWVARRKRLPLIFHCHSRLTQSVAVWLAAGALRVSRAHLIACCRYAAEPLVPSVEDDRFHLIYNGVPGPGALVRKPRGAAEYRIGVLGRVSPEKGQAEFIEAARVVLRVVPRCRFVICGEPLFSDPVAESYARKLKRMAVGLPVEFLGWRDDVYSVIADLDAVVVPSLREPAATRVILEAFASGVPVVAFASGGIAEVLADSETGVLVNELSPGALAAGILFLFEADPSKIEQLRANGVREWRRRFTLERFQRDVITVIDQAAAGKAEADAVAGAR